MDVEQYSDQLDIPTIIKTLLTNFSAVTDYRTLRDSLPRRLVALLQCRCVLLYLLVGETLQLASGSFDDLPGWSAALLAVAHVNPIDVQSDEPEARAWRERRVILRPVLSPTLLAVPLLYRQRAIGVMVLLRGPDEDEIDYPAGWSGDLDDSIEAVAGVVALLLENARLLERDRERIHELSLLNSISSQMNGSLFEAERLRSAVLQRTREIAGVELCELLEPDTDVTGTNWLTPRLRSLLFQRFREQRSLMPLVIERPGDGKHAYVHDYFEELPERVKTFFAIPLLRNQPLERSAGERLEKKYRDSTETALPAPIFGCIVGGYYRPWKMRQSEIALLQVVASQASAALENRYLVDEVVVARNEARRLLRQVLEDQRLHELILESVPSGLIATDQTGCIHTFNRAAAIILGYHPYEVLGQPLQKILDLRANHGSHAAAAVNRALPDRQQEAFLVGMHIGEVQSETVVTMDRYERELVLEVDMRPLYDDSGTQMGLLTTFTDVTTMHKLEEERRRLDRLASLGEMAASVAHEVRNPLASIKTSIQMLHNDLLIEEEGDAPTPIRAVEQQAWIQESTSVVLKEVERLDSIVRDLLLFARPRQLHRIRCDIVDLCEQVLALLQNQCAEANVEIHRIFDELPPIWVDTAQMEQAILNLSLNAIQAMPDGGVLTLECHCISTERAIYDTAGSDCPPTQRPSGTPGIAGNAYAWLIDKHVSQKEFRVDQWLEILIMDTGVGIAPEQLKYIFQPFYTTKAHGIGLGLAITRRLIEDHGGYLRIESQYGYGATIAIRMPYVTGDVIAEHPHASPFDVSEKDV
ncbi:ATP-binding protein [Dictyobacter formicarum]|nr:ATP-binding protein [Dictyobacter formicarum]